MKSYCPYPKATTMKPITSEDIQKDIDEFLANGGEIVKYDIIVRQEDEPSMLKVTNEEKLYGQ